MSDNKSISDLWREAVGTVERLKVLLHDAEQASMKANSESGYAFNAKTNAEEHGKAVSQMKGQAEADLSHLAAMRKSADEAMQVIESAKSVIEGDAKYIAGAKDLAEEDVAAARELRRVIETTLSSTAESQGTIAASVEYVNNALGGLAVSKSTVDAATTAVQGMQAQVAEMKAKVGQHFDEIGELHDGAEESVEAMKEAAKTSETTLKRLDAYEKKLEDILIKSNALHSKIESLLPNATSAGLASAFRNQQQRFQDPQRNWLKMFIVTIALLLLAGVVGLPGFWPGGGNDNWDAILRHLVTRLPLVAPLIWLAVYAGRHYTLALRVEEEYAFKEAVSTAFEGYKREMAGISGDETVSAPLVTLCENVLRALAQRPGRIYEGRHDDITPVAPFAKAAGEFLNGLGGKDKKTS